MKVGQFVKHKWGNDFGHIVLSPSQMEGATMYMVCWGTYRYTWEREEDLICM